MISNIPKLYLDTSVISALHDDRTPERKTLTERFWESLENDQVFISALVTEEIDAAKEAFRQKMLASVNQFQILKINSEVETLAEQYLQFNIFPEKYLDDALHVSFAVVNHNNYVVSWNFKHLVKVKTRKMVNLVNEINGFPAVEIIAPPEL